MMSFCKRSVHSRLCFNNFMASGAPLESPTHLRNIQSPACGLSFVTLFDDLRRPINLIEFAGVKSPPSCPTTTTAATKRNSVNDDHVGGSYCGSCTESLGFESLDKSVVDDEIENVINQELGSNPSSPTKSRSKRSEKVYKNFPPPLSSLDRNGRPNFVLRPVRKDGRLELNVVKIERREVLCASRQDGRLRLSVVVDEDGDFDDKDEYETTEDKEEVVEERGGGHGSQWLFPTTNTGGDGFSRCHVAVSHHHNHPIV